jgi:hypothetical protein
MDVPDEEDDDFTLREKIHGYMLEQTSVQQRNPLWAFTEKDLTMGITKTYDNVPYQIFPSMFLQYFKIKGSFGSKIVTFDYIPQGDVFLGINTTIPNKQIVNCTFDGILIKDWKYIRNISEEMKIELMYPVKNGPIVTLNERKKRENITISIEFVKNTTSFGIYFAFVMCSPSLKYLLE